MNNQTDLIQSIVKSCKNGEMIKINPKTGEIKIYYHDTKLNKNIYRTVGNLFKNDDTILPIPAHPWVNINNNAFPAYNNFGKEDNKKQDLNNTVVIGMFEFMLEFGEFIPGKSSDFNYKYDTKKIGEYTGFYNKDGKLRFVEFKGIKYHNS